MTDKIESFLQNKDNYIFDLDGTICEEKDKGTSYEDYANVKPKKDVVEVIKKLKELGKTITILTARHMRTMKGDVDKVIDRIGDITEKWLDDNDIPYDAIWYGKPYGMVQVDDRSITPGELVYLNRDNKLDEIDNYLNEKDLTLKVNNIMNLFSHSYYVYQWYYLDENKEKHIFYVGKGQKLRAFDTKRNDVFNKIYDEQDCRVEIIKMFDTNDEALEFEKSLKYAQIDLGYCEGSLDDERGRIINKRPKKPKINDTKKPDGRKNKSPETNKKISETKKRRKVASGFNNPRCKVTEEILISMCNDFNKGLRPKQIVNNYQLSQSQINRIFYGTAHREITEKYLEDGYAYKR